MNPSRISYSYSIDSNLDKAFLKDVILQSCEFCSRTFIPDSLARHRKVCYKDFLKKRSTISKKSRHSSRSKSERITSGRDLADLNVTELMLKRQRRRMHWRGRHEDFIKTIRDAREYATATDCGLTVPPSSTTLEQQEDMQQCKYCLRKFHAHSFEKHLERCKEYSLRINRLKPNEAQIEAKRRLSLRLYYKPKSYRGDSPDDISTSFSSNDLCCNYDFQDVSQRKSRESNSMSINVHSKNTSKIRRQSSMSIDKSEVSVKSNNIKRHKSTVPENPRESIKSSQSILFSRNPLPNSTNPRSLEKDNSSSVIKEKHKISNHAERMERSIQNYNKKMYEKNHLIGNGSTASLQSTKPTKSHIKNERISTQLKAISNLLTDKLNNSNYPNNDRKEEFLSKNDFPNPAESLKKAKEILQFLDLRMQRNELSSENRSEDDISDKDNQLKKTHQEQLYGDSFDDRIPFMRPNDIKLNERKDKDSYNDIYSNFSSEYCGKTDAACNGADNTNENCAVFQKIEKEHKEEEVGNKSEYKDVIPNETKTHLIDKEVIRGQKPERETCSLPYSYSMKAHIDPEYARIWKVTSMKM